MKSKHFYHHLVETTDITIELAELDMSSDERVHLLSLVDANIHSTVVKVVLDNLEDEDKKIFLKNLSTQNHEEIWKHLKSKTKDLEKQIKEEVNKLKEDFKKDIQETKIKP